MMPGVSIDRIEPCADLVGIQFTGSITGIDVAELGMNLDLAGFRVVHLRYLNTVVGQRDGVVFTVGRGGAFSLSRVKTEAEGRSIISDLVDMCMEVAV